MNEHGGTAWDREHGRAGRDRREGSKGLRVVLAQGGTGASPVCYVLRSFVLAAGNRTLLRISR